MIIEDVFKEFAQVVGENRMYEISLLNAHGIIVQTTMADAKGTQIADQTDTEDKVFYPLNVDGVFYGTLMVQGSNMSVIAPLIRDSLVTRVRFELQKMRIDNQMSNGELLVQMLVDPYAFDSEKVFRLCEKMNIRTDCYRVCIYLVCSSGFDSKAIANLNLLPDDDIPICSLINPKELVIFRSVAEEKMDKEMMEASLQSYFRSLRHIGITADRVFISMPSRKIHEYHVSFESCKWLAGRDAIKDRIVFMSEHLFEYLTSGIKPQFLSQVIDSSILEKKNINVDEFIEIAQRMVEADFSINKTAQMMFVHKNTLIYKLKKYEAALGIDITGSTKGRVVFTLIADELADEKQKKYLGL
ncbi:MAG: helix-turn-helix domain-containing protein [Erysipelotrichaceae bacterium]|jgi:carbohydrate diacid regulator